MPLWWGVPPNASNDKRHPFLVQEFALLVYRDTRPDTIFLPGDRIDANASYDKTKFLSGERTRPLLENALPFWRLNPPLVANELPFRWAIFLFFHQYCYWYTVTLGAIQYSLPARGFLLAHLALKRPSFLVVEFSISVYREARPDEIYLCGGGDCF